MLASSICLDASFVVGLVTNPERDRFRQRLESWQDAGARLVAPALLHFEVANAFYQYQRHGKLSAETVDSVMEMVSSLGIETVSDPRLHREALTLANRLELPAAYDAHYLALARRLDCELWTVDRKLARRVEGYFAGVRLATES